MDLTLGAWGLIKTTPSLLALLPLLVYIVIVFLNKSNLSALVICVALATILTGQGVKALSSLFVTSLGSFLGVIGLIIMFGSGLGYLMNRARVSHTLVYWIVKGIGVNNEKKGMIATLVSAIIICGLLGTLAGGNAVIAPVIIPVVAAVGLTPTVVCTLLKVGGEIGLIVGPLTGVTLATMGLTKLSYGQLMLWAALPFSIVWILATWYAVTRIQNKYRGKEVYTITEDMVDLNSIVITKQQKLSTILFLVTFALLVVYGVITKQGTNYALIVMLILSAVISISSKIEIDSAISTFAEGASKMTEMFLIFILFNVLFDLMNIGGGFEALGHALQGLVSATGKAGVTIVAAVVGGFGIEAAAVAELKIVNEMFAPLVQQAGLPMAIWATALIAATRITGSLYPSANLAGQLGIARCTNTKGVIQASWIGAAALWVWVILWSFVGPLFFQ